MQKGIIKTEYNKTVDNYKAYFSNDAIHNEFHNCISVLMRGNTPFEFSVSDFLRVYNDKENPLRFEKMFSTKNTKKLIDAWVGKFNTENKGYYFEYNNRRKWIKVNK